MTDSKKMSIGESLIRLQELLSDRSGPLYQHEWVTQDWGTKHFGSELEGKFVSLLTPEVVAFLLNIPKEGHPDYAIRNVRGNPDMQAAYQDTYECNWIEGNPRSRLHFALGFSAALGKQVERIQEAQEEVIRAEKDNCQVCLGESGGVLGNENRIDGLVVCDYCHVKMSNGLVKSPEAPFDFETARTHNDYVWNSLECKVEGCVWCQLQKNKIQL